MARVQRVSTSGGPEPDPVAIGEQVDAVLRVVDDKIEFGEPQDPSDPASAVRAGVGFETPTAGAHNGTLSNIAGSWVEVALESTGMTMVECHHNLFSEDSPYTVPVTGQPNCRWLVFGVQHDGTGSDANTRLGVDVTFAGDTVAVNYLELRFNLRVEGQRPTIGSSNPVLVTLFFTQATRGE